MPGFTVTEWNHRMLKDLIPEGGFCIDATAGTGRDTLYLSQAVGKNGTVLAFDIQQEALDMTRERLKKEQCPDNTELILDSHAHMDRYAEKGMTDAILFNFGYLPGGDHSLATRADTSLEAVQKGLELLKTGGVMSLCVYSGGDTGFAERDALFAFAEGLHPKEYLVIRNDFFNRPNHPPVILLIFALKNRENR